MRSDGTHREIHFWHEGLEEPPCGTLEDRFEWSDEIGDVTCDACREALAAGNGELSSPDAGDRQPPA